MPPHTRLGMLYQKPGLYSELRDNIISHLSLPVGIARFGPFREFACMPRPCQRSILEQYLPLALFYSAHVSCTSDIHGYNTFPVSQFAGSLARRSPFPQSGKSLSIVNFPSLAQKFLSPLPPKCVGYDLPLEIPLREEPHYSLLPITRKDIEIYVSFTFMLIDRT